MSQKLQGIMIRKHRQDRNWSQSTLCRGICAVSYLSKIEQGKAEGSEEVVELLFERLSLAGQFRELLRVSEQSYFFLEAGRRAYWKSEYGETLEYQLESTEPPHNRGGFVLLLCGREKGA